ncbi:hypothetical protein DsansV1_C07g0073231 [Dioscorea sansibarensis]
MDENLSSRYWCHMCSQMVSPIMEMEIKCPYCDSGFVEEMQWRGNISDASNDLGSDRDRALSLWAPILFRLMNNQYRRRRAHREGGEEEGGHENEEEELRSVLRRRRRSSAIIQVLQGLRDNVRPESDMPESENERDGQRVILLNPFNQAIILQGSMDGNHSNEHELRNNGIGASIGDYFIGSGLDVLLQHLAENDPNQYGTPPAQKKAVEAMPTVKVPAEESKNVNEAGNGRRVESSNGGGGNGRRFWIPVPWPFSGLFSTSGQQGSENSSSTSSSSTTNGSNNSNISNVDED